jgi:hypothetical protein
VGLHPFAFGIARFEFYSHLPAAAEMGLGYLGICWPLVGLFRFTRFASSGKSEWLLAMSRMPNKSPEPTAVGAVSSAVAVHATILTFVLLSFLIAGCSRRDAKIQKELTGTWHRDYGHGFQITNVIAADGSYEVQVVGLNNVTVGSSEGSLIAKNGALIDTVTKDGNTNAQTPRVIQWQIVHIDERELVMSSKFNTDKGALVKTYEKVEK